MIFSAFSASPTVAPSLAAGALLAAPASAQETIKIGAPWR